jgi:ketosteroid isomerase-like protein
MLHILSTIRRSTVNTRTRTILAVLVVFALLAATAAFAADGKAQGTITVNGKTTKLSYAYARAVPGFFDKKKEDVEVILSDVPLEGKALEDQFERMHMAADGKLHTFEITVNADASPISTSFNHNGFKGPSPSGLSSDDVFTKKTFDGKTVDASYKSAKQHEFFGNTYAFDVSFRAEITRKAKPVPPTAAETAAAQKSPQAKVYADFMKAIQKEDLGAVRKLMTKEQAKNLDSPDAKKMVGMIKAMAATDVKVLKVVEKGDTAELTVSGKQDGSLANGVVHMAKEDGAWKVQREEWN